MKVLGIIPARGGSKGVRRKNIKILNGKPLIEYTINSAINSELSRIIVSTDDIEISNFANSLNIETPFKRPANLSSDQASSLDVAIHGLLETEKIDNIKYDAVMLLQPTTPFRTKDDINSAIEIIRNNNVDSVISVVNVGGNHPARMKYIKNNRLIDPPFCEIVENQNRQELEPMYIRNGAIYLTKRSVLLNKSFKGQDSYAYVMSENTSVNIDTQKDFDYANWISKNNL